VLLGLGETSEPVVIKAHPAFAVEGKIITADGRACEEGSLTLSRPGSEAIGHDTEDDGRVHVRGVLPGEYAVHVQCVGFVAAEQYPAIRVVNASLRELRWHVEVGRAVRGVIIDPRGKPVPGVNVSARPKADPAQPRARTVTGRSERSDDSGRFEVPGLLPGAYDLSIYTYPESRARPEQPTAVTVTADSDLEGVRIEMPAVGELRGKLRDTQGRGIARASLEVTGKQSRQGTTADDGSFRIDNIGVGSHRVTVRRGSALLRPPGKSDDDIQGEPFEIQADTVTSLDLVVADPSGIITGIVREDDGGPVQDAQVSATRESESAAASGGALQNSRVRVGDRPVLSDADGRFRIDGLSPGKYTLQALRPRGGDAMLEHVELGGDVVLAIAPASRIAGIVARATGGAPDEFSITVHNRARGFSRSDRFFRTGGAWGFGEVPPGAIEVQVSGADGTQRLELELGAGEQKSDLRIELAAKVTVRGKVADLDGAPVVGVEVHMSETGSFRFGMVPTDPRQITDDAGRFEVVQASTGPVTVMVGKPADINMPMTYLRMEIAGGGPVVELPPLRVSRPRTRPDEAIGDLGHVLRQSPPGTAPDQVHHVVALVRPGSPAAAAGLQVGDEIVSVDGHDVTGTSAYLYQPLLRVAEGATVQLGLARGVTLAITAGKRP
jgi:protocatechuate 3,4-dioxygenase beta subunit